MKSRLSLFLFSAVTALSLTSALAQKPLPNRVFGSSRFRIDSLLSRPYDREVPFGASGDRVWASSPQGWAFGEGVNLLTYTNMRAFEVTIRVGDANYRVAKAEYFPSHVHMIGAPEPSVNVSSSVPAEENKESKEKAPFFSGGEETRREVPSSALLPPSREGVGGEENMPGIRVEADKWITQDDVLVTRITITNSGKKPQPLFVRMETDFSGTLEGFEAVWRVQDVSLALAAGGTDGRKRAARFLADISPAQTRTFTFACAVTRDDGEARSRLRRVLSDRVPLKTHTDATQEWFDRNVAYFECSDPMVTKIYYHRWHLLKKNSLDPKMGALRHKTFANGRWTSDWRANILSSGAAHQIREARWLRDPSYAWGHLQTWTENARADGIFPGRITSRGQQGGQYTEWIGATAWDTYLLHPDKERLAKVADPVARNAQGWRKVYGWDNSPTLVVDDHRWTGMAWQPSFFAFADYKTGGDGTDREYRTPLRRVDLTAYNFGNAQAAARIYAELGRGTDAAKLQRLAAETRDALLAQMWNPQTKWFHSLRATDYVKAPDKEIIGLAPFYFDLPPKGKGYEAVWETALDPKRFWTPWPLASVSQDSPAYGQNGWPGGGDSMGNGPTWPFANSIVLAAMANTLRRYAPSALTKEKLYALFHSFTKAQFQKHNVEVPWTGDYYNGETGAWKTPQRDVFESAWIDPLLRDLIGIVPRPDNLLEIDPLLPEGVWKHYILDGQAYRGHNISIAFDAEGNRIAPGFRGYAVFLDGKEIYRGERPVSVLYDMEAGRLLTDAPAMPD